MRLYRLFCQPAPLGSTKRQRGAPLQIATSFVGSPGNLRAQALNRSRSSATVTPVTEAKSGINACLNWLHQVRFFWQPNPAAVNYAAATKHESRCPSVGD